MTSTTSEPAARTVARFFPEPLQLCEAADEPWLWTLFEMTPSSVRAAKLSEAKIARLP